MTNTSRKSNSSPRPKRKSKPFARWSAKYSQALFDARYAFTICYSDAFENDYANARKLARALNAARVTLKVKP